MKKVILTISIVFLLLSLIYTNTFATEIIIGNQPANNTSTNNTTNNTNISNTNTSNTNSSNTNGNTTNTNKTNIVTNKNTTNTKVNSSYTNTNLPNTGSEDFVIGFVIAAGIISAIYAYVKIKIYNI